MDIDYLIIGHGLAGANLAHLLEEVGYSVMLIDQPDKNHSSSVAAGLYNPVTGRKMVKTWMADKLFPVLKTHYQKLEKKLDTKFLHQIGIYRPFADIAEFNDWSAKETDANFSHLIEAIANARIPEFSLHDTFGGLHLANSGYLDVPSLINASRSYFQDKDLFIEEWFEENHLRIEHNSLEYHGIKAKNLICCNGTWARDSKLFGWLPFKIVKGEILDVRFDHKPQKVYNRGLFILPRFDGSVRIGSNYQNNFDTLEPTKEGKMELVQKLTQLTSAKYEVVSARAGIRPATKDRRPFIGKHPEYEHIYMFNGFGSKGVSMIPYFARDFVEFIQGNKPLNKDADITRYSKLYGTQG